jgi:hypothetical protein
MNCGIKIPQIPFTNKQNALPDSPSGALESRLAVLFMEEPLKIPKAADRFWTHGRKFCIFKPEAHLQSAI